MRSYLRNAIGIKEEDNLAVDEIIRRMTDHYRKKSSIAVDRVTFNKRKQETGESFDNYFAELSRLADNAELCSLCRDDQIVTKIMSDIKDEETKRKLLAINPMPNLQKVIDICRADETAKKDAEIISESKYV